MLDGHCKQGFDQQCVTFAVSQENVGMAEKFREFFLSRQKTCLSRNPKNGEKKVFGSCISTKSDNNEFLGWQVGAARNLQMVKPEWQKHDCQTSQTPDTGLDTIHE